MYIMKAVKIWKKKTFQEYEKKRITEKLYGKKNSDNVHNVEDKSKFWNVVENV